MPQVIIYLPTYLLISRIFHSLLLSVGLCHHDPPHPPPPPPVHPDYPMPVGITSCMWRTSSSSQVRLFVGVNVHLRGMCRKNRPAVLVLFLLYCRVRHVPITISGHFDTSVKCDRICSLVGSSSWSLTAGSCPEVAIGK